MNATDIRRVTDYLWEVPPTGRMLVPARVYATERMMTAILRDRAVEQAANVACLPGIVSASLAMPDIHWGYGFPIGGVAAFDAGEGVVSPGGVGYDINCGVRLMTCRLTRAEVQPRMRELVNALFHGVPTGIGASGDLKVSGQDLAAVAVQGSGWAVARGYGTETDREHTEESGCLRGADPSRVSARAVERGRGQLGTLGSGNHFLEVGFVSEIYDPAAAQVLGLAPNQVTLIIHCGSRGYGHQVAEDYLLTMDRALRRYGIDLPDRQLACAPLASPEGQAYLAAMACAVNFAFANRQVIAHQAQQVFSAAFGKRASASRLWTVYEVAHNIAKLERHVVDGRERTLCVHRKGATRAFPAGHPEVPAAFRGVGQPVLIPGDMGRYSFVLLGTERAMQATFGSTCHGAGRLMGRHEATRVARGRDVIGELSDKGIVVAGQSRRTLDEEISDAYKDVADVVETCVLAGISRKVAKLTPLGCIKG